MQVKVNQISSTKLELIITGTQEELSQAKQHAVNQLGGNIKVPGFRTGKSPAGLAEKYIDPNKLSQSALEAAINNLYSKSLIEQSIRPVAEPAIDIIEYVPYSSLTFKAHVDAIGTINLGQYKGLSIKQTKSSVTQQQINEVIERLRQQLATRKETTAKAVNGDEVIIDFDGIDSKTKELIANAQGNDYPLIIGSNSFIPGFEPELIGLKKGETKDFDITFPKDYHVAQLRAAKVTFTVSVKQVNKLTLPKIDDNFAAQVGPFKNLAELKQDIKKNIQSDLDNEALTKQQNDIIDQILKTSTVDLPDILVQEEKQRIEEELRSNASYHGLTWKEYLASIDSDEKKIDTTCLEEAKTRIKTGLLLGDIAVKEKLSLSNEEVNAQIKRFKQQYANDKQMLAELDKPKNINDLKNRLFVQKTIDYLVTQNSITK